MKEWLYLKKTDKLRTNIIFVAAVAVLCTLLWGTAFPAIKIGYELFRIDGADIPSKFLFAGARFFIAGIVVLLIGLFTEKDKKALIPQKKDLLPVSVLGFFQTFCQYLLLYIGISYITGTKSALLTSVSAFGSVILSAVFLKGDRLGARKIAGCVIGTAGILAMNLGSELGGFTLIGDGLVILSNLSGAAGNVVSKKISGGRSPALLAGWQLIFGGGGLCILGAALGGRLDLSSLAATAVLLYLALMAGTAFMLWTMLLKYNPVSRVAVFNLLIPVFGTMWSGIFLGENIFTLNNGLSLLLVCSGIFVVNYPAGEKAKKN